VVIESPFVVVFVKPDESRKEQVFQAHNPVVDGMIFRSLTA
jgi:hypothetical protein